MVRTSAKEGARGRKGGRGHTKKIYPSKTPLYCTTIKLTKHSKLFLFCLGACTRSDKNPTAECPNNFDSTNAAIATTVILLLLPLFLFCTTYQCIDLLLYRDTDVYEDASDDDDDDDEKINKSTGRVLGISKYNSTTPSEQPGWVRGNLTESRGSNILMSWWMLVADPGIIERFKKYL